jgi:hypothetical protein
VLQADASFHDELAVHPIAFGCEIMSARADRVDQDIRQLIAGLSISVSVRSPA